MVAKYVRKQKKTYLGARDACLEPPSSSLGTTVVVVVLLTRRDDGRRGRRRCVGCGDGGWLSSSSLDVTMTVVELVVMW
jgi:hypothetical protein